MIIFLLIYMAIGVLFLLYLTVFYGDSLVDVAQSISDQDGTNIYIVYLVIDILLVFGGIPLVIYTLITDRKDKEI